VSKQDFTVTPPSADVHYGIAATSHYVSKAATMTRLSGEDAAHSSPVAVLVCHGMGEQVRFETIGQVAASVLKEAVGQGCTAIGTGVELSQQNDSFLARAELNWVNPAGVSHSVHVYEAYWAPITEGKVTYLDTVFFLFSAAWAGIRSSRFFRVCTFQRYIFGGLQDLPIYSSTKAALIALSMFLLAQVAAIAIVMAKLADQIKQIEAAHFALKQIALILLPGIHSVLDHSLSITQRLLVLLSIIGWYLLVAEILLVRYFLIQYVGDVAAYISPYKASKFDEIRTKIQAVGLNVARVIYGFQNSSTVPDYQRVVFVGHSLGSVLAYDTLNAAINLDNTSATPGSHRVFDRTTHLVTFGSPLDKTAFLFRNQSNHIQDPLREQMSAAFQPLVLDYSQFRKPNFWTNIYSPRDIISGSLEYYDLPSLSPTDTRRVQNVPDPDANIPLYAHVQYWANTLLAQTLYNAVK
jgi:hypothetical protein